MPHITANDLKTKGIAAIEAILQDHTEAIVSVRGHARFVVMELDHYNHLRECELEAALAESRADVTAGRFVDGSADAHVARLLADD
ncbi:prevent-host-death protein [Solimicrobium silvestre]|uniref:Prevent-host-death protein n=1 Tax=Solimicrobium silvestre TaxID=2099400 RepID=A0A2S9H2N8_9BURK|nr:prevent-host-death protein [Solimicrobium silvestre]PRC94241.1 hypothetical protein S2091_0862 [Solimicrobium silvestre]